MSEGRMPMSITEEPATGLPCSKCTTPQPRIHVAMQGNALLVRVAERIDTREDLRGLIDLLKMFEGNLPARSATKRARKKGAPAR